MNVDKKLVEEIAHLARLEFRDQESERIINELNRMLNFIEKLNELDTSETEPLIYMNEETNVLREDEAKTDISRQDALRNAPRHDSDYFRTPKVVERK